MCFGPFKKICSWGPLTALAIIKIIILTTLHCSKQWWSPHKSAFSDTSFIFFIIFCGSTLYHFINSIYEGPGHLPYNWVPEKKKDCQFLQFCNVCQGYKAPRSHHCRKCGRCILKMDHHCPWINNCVGHNNHGYFTAFLTSSVIGCCFSTYIMTSWLVTMFSTRPLPFQPPSIFILGAVLFSIGLSIGVVIAVGMLLYFQMQAILKNQTGIECWIVEKANYRRTGTGEKFVHPYSKGWLFNLKQVISWHCMAPGDGINWPIKDGCDKYTLTREQIAQKQEKRKRARQYRVVARATGSWIPISHGLKVLFTLPFTDEPRIKLEVGDIVTVTRWRHNWLFGEKDSIGVPTDGKDTRIRGWFPRPCVIPLSELNEGLEDYYVKESNEKYIFPNTSGVSKTTEIEEDFDNWVKQSTLTNSNTNKKDK